MITNVVTASAFPADGWSIGSVSRVVRTARTRQENHEKEYADYSYIHDEVTISDIFPATGQGLDGGEHPAENTIPEDDQEDETEQSLSDSLQTRRQISRIHEYMGHPSNRTLVRVLRLGGAMRRFILAAAKHSCGACEAQKRPVGPIVSRSPNSFVFIDVVRLDLFFLNTYAKHTLLAINIVCWSIGLQRVILLRDQSGAFLKNAYRNNWHIKSLDFVPLGKMRKEQSGDANEMFAGLAAPVTLVSWRSHRVKRVVASASAAEAMGLSEAIPQGDWVRALWSEMVLGLSLREWREQENVPPLISVTDSKGNYDQLHNETVGPSEDRKGAI